MTVRLSPESPRRSAAARFAEQLRGAMAARQVGRRRLAELLGMQSASLVAAWRSGETLPRRDSAIRLAECLDCPALLRIVDSVRTQRCELCPVTFVNEGGRPKRYCSARCRAVAQKMRAGTSTRERAAVAERRLEHHIRAVERMCRGCEPEGRCRRADCALRELSPFPLATDRRADPPPASPAPGPYGSPANAARTREATRRAATDRWARPGERERMGKLLAARHAQRRGEVARRRGVDELEVTIEGATQRLAASAAIALPAASELVIRLAGDPPVMGRARLTLVAEAANAAVGR